MHDMSMLHDIFDGWVKALPAPMVPNSAVSALEPGNVVCEGDIAAGTRHIGAVAPIGKCACSPVYDEGDTSEVKDDNMDEVKNDDVMHIVIRNIISQERKLKEFDAGMGSFISCVWDIFDACEEDAETGGIPLVVDACGNGGFEFAELDLRDAWHLLSFMQNNPMAEADEVLHSLRG